jgi:hypothetical protein
MQFLLEGIVTRALFAPYRAEVDDETTSPDFALVLYTPGHWSLGNAYLLHLIL